MKHGGYTFLFDTTEGAGERVFYDPTMIRRRKIQRLILAAMLIFAAWFLLFFDGVVFGQNLTKTFTAWRSNQAVMQASHAPHEPQEMRLAQAAVSASPSDVCGDRPAPLFSAFAEPARESFVGHLPDNLEWAPLSLQKSCGSLDVLVPDWISLREKEGHLFVEVAEPHIRAAVENYARSARVPPSVLPSVTLSPGEDGPAFLELVKRAGPEAIAELVSAARGLNVQGLCVDFQQLNEAQMQPQLPLLRLLAAELRAARLQSCVILSVSQKIWLQKGALDGFDRVILTAFSQPWVGTVPGPLAGDEWFQEMAKQALETIGADRLTLAIGNFAVEWTPQVPMPETLPIAEAMERISRADGQVSFNAAAGNSFGSYRDTAGKMRKVWFLDAISTHNQMRMLRALGVHNIGIWSLGQEDPGLWSVVSRDANDQAALAAEIADVSFPNYVAYQGNGPLLRMVSEPQQGQRSVGFDPKTGKIVTAFYTRLPKPFLMERYGRAAANKLVLTFDDGPSPVFTAAILDELKTSKTPAAFFVVGSQVMAASDILQRMFDEGHEVGSHTFSHPHMNKISRTRADFEYGMMAKMIASYSNHITRLYREPYMNATGPIDEKGVRSLLPLLSDGAVVAGMDVLARDWEGLSRDEIVGDVVAQIEAGAGNVILLHDNGEDRQATVDAIPVLIKVLRSKGYEFTTLAELSGLDRSILMPLAEGSQLSFDKMSFDFLATVWLSLKTIFWVVLGIGVARTLMIFGMALFPRKPLPLSDGLERRVTVVIPAYNEEVVVAKCIRSVLASTYRNLDIVAIDDGSKDDTFYQLLQFRNNPRVQVFAQPNQGKWSALNAAVANVESEIIVCIDADTQIHPDAIGHLARQFSCPRVGAVAGKIIVGNRTNLLTRLQALEYITAQNFDRRGFDLIDGMLVVPGAIGAWRTEAVRKAGGFCNDTLTEDADLTTCLHRLGYRVTYEDKAIAYTEAPETIGQLLSQRLRWTLGMFQCAWKHKGAIREGRAVGIVSIPDMFIFGYLFPLLAPIADAFVLLLLFNHFNGSSSGSVGEVVASGPIYLVWGYLALPMLDLIVAAYALATDKDEKMWLILLFPFQRFFYRQLLYLSVYRAIFRAISGSFAGWGKLKRTNRQFAQIGAR